MGISFSVGSAHAVTVVNGSMNTSDTSINVNSFNGVQPDGWMDIDPLTSTDIFDATTNFNGFTWAPSSDGGTFVHGVDAISVIPGEGIIQEISGLTIGTTYLVNFEQSISWNTGGRGEGGFWEVVFGNETKQSSFMTNSGQGVAFGWQDQSLSFTATAETQSLSFQVAPDIFVDRIDLGLDGVSVSVIPIPPAVWLLGSGLIGLLGISRRKLT